MRDSQKGLGCLALFALPFAGVGLFMGYLTVKALWEWREMRSWHEVPATIESVELESHRDSESNSTSYEAVASYRYTHEGVEYRGDRVSLHAGADNVGDFQQEVRGELSRAMQSGNTVSCFVNPARPEEAILYREPRWGLVGLYLVVVVVFGGAGFGLLWAGIFGSRKMAREEELALLHPDEPWLRKDEWREGRIASTAKPVFVTSVFFAVIWNAISAPLLFIVPGEYEKGNVAALIGLVFPLVGVGLAFWAGKNLVRLLKFGASFLEMDAVPGVIGGRLTGRIRTSARIDSSEKVELRLSAVRSKRVGSGKNARSEESIVWQKSHWVSAGPGLHGHEAAIPVSFVIPDDQPQTDDADPHDRLVWQLHAVAEIPGVDFDTRFEVPVFRTPESGKVAIEEEKPTAASGPDLDARLDRAGIRREHLPMGARYVFPARREVGAMLLTTFIFAVCAAVSVVLFYSDVPRIFFWALSAFNLLFFLAVIDLWLYSSRIDVRPGEVAFRGGLFGRGDEKRWSAGEVAKVDTRPGMQAGGRQYHQIVVVTRWDKRHVVAKRIPDLATAEHIAGHIEAVLRT